jgi:hypothetical protein
MTKGKAFEIENICIIENGKRHRIKISVYEGLWVGFETEKNILDFKDFQIDLSQMQKVKINNGQNLNIDKLVYGLSSDKLDLNNLNEFEIDGKLFYQIKDLEDGNYIAINEKGQVFGLIHDPYKIELIDTSLKNFVEKVNNGQVDFDKYLAT